MTITKEITRLEKSSVKMNITVGKDDVRSEYDELLSTYSKSIQIPGFRKGKVPQDVLIRKFGEALKGEALGKVIEKTIEQIFADETFPKESRPLPYSTPQMQDEPKLDLENDLAFAVVYDVLPAVKVEKWENIEIEVPDVSVEDEDLDRELQLIQDRNSIVLDKNEDETAAKNDVVTINYTELDDSDQPIQDGGRDDFSFTLGTGQILYKFDDELSGMKKGETKEFSKTYPEDFEEPSLAGKTKKFKVTLTALKVKKLPDLDDDLAQDVDDKFKTLDDLKNSIRDRLNKDIETRLRTLKINKILEIIMGNTPVEIPESMIRLELDSRWKNLARRLNTDTEGLLKIVGNNQEGVQSIIGSWKPDAEKALHSRLIVETLMDDLKLEASDEEIEKELVKIADESGVDPEEVRKYYEADQMKEYLKEEIREHKVFDILLSKNQIKTGNKVKYVDLIGNNV